MSPCKKRFHLVVYEGQKEVAAQFTRVTWESLWEVLFEDVLSHFKWQCSQHCSQCIAKLRVLPNKKRAQMFFGSAPTPQTAMKFFHFLMEHLKD